MSMPIIVCHIVKAANGDAAAKATLKIRCEYNRGKGAVSVWPCKCQPKCEAPEDGKLVALLEEIPGLAAILL